MNQDAADGKATDALRGHDSGGEERIFAFVCSAERRIYPTGDVARNAVKTLPSDSIRCSRRARILPAKKRPADHHDGR